VQIEFYIDAQCPVTKCTNKQFKDLQALAVSSKSQRSKQPKTKALAAL